MTILNRLKPITVQTQVRFPPPQLVAPATADANSRSERLSFVAGNTAVYDNHRMIY